MKRGFFMRTARIPVITIQWLAVIVILGLLPWVVIPGATDTVNEELR
jgi:hypothetical protein